MSDTIDSFQKELFHDVSLTADSEGGFKEDAFFEIVAGHLIAAGELETHQRTLFQDRGLRIDGHGGHPRDSDGVLSLIVMDFDQSDEINSLTATDMDAVFKRLTNFLDKARDANFRNHLEESSPAFEAALQIANSWGFANKLKLILVTNKRLSARVDGRAATSIDGKGTTFSVWDLERLWRYVSSGREREEMEINLVADFGGSIPVLPAHLAAGDYEAFLAVVPGAQVAAIYDRWGSRLLEQNVRSFLQLKGKVNTGMAKTIKETPEMFFAYNNGITATAESVEFAKDGRAITKIQNLQIVNGGQTTASLHHQRSRGEPLEHIFVQMKLSIVKPDMAEDIVPKISEFANTQNKVNAADFFANHPYHIELEKLSRRILAPAKEGSFAQTHWFYERSRGQFINARAGLTRAAQKKFDADSPKGQLITKTDLAKVLNLWPGYTGINPASVCRGAQKTFSEFAASVSKAWTDTHSNEINEDYFKGCVAKVIIFKETEKLVSSRPWYQTGYRAQIVAHSIGKLAWDLQERKDELAFQNVWAAQGLTQGVREVLVAIIDEVRNVITNPATAGQNISEWAKQQACWKRVQDLEIIWPVSLSRDLRSLADAKDEKKLAKKEKRAVSGKEAQGEVVGVGATFWGSLLEWGNAKRLLSAKEAGALAAAARPTFFPSETQAVVIVELKLRLEAAGFGKNQ